MGTAVVTLKNIEGRASRRFQSLVVENATRNGDRRKVGVLIEQALQDVIPVDVVSLSKLAFENRSLLTQDVDLDVVLPRAENSIVSPLVLIVANVAAHLREVLCKDARCMGIAEDELTVASDFWMQPDQHVQVNASGVA